MLRKISKWTLILMATLFLSVSIQAATYTVDDDGAADFSSIQDAIDAASASDIVYVYPGVYQEQVTMKDEVNLYGAGPHVTTIDGQGLYEHVVTFNGTNGATLSGFRVIGSQPVGGAGTWHHSGVYVESGPLIIRNNIIEGNHGGIAVESSGNPTIVNNTIVDNSNGIILATRTSVSAIEPRVAFIYSTDFAAAETFKTLIENRTGFATDLIHINNVAVTNFSIYGLIIAGADTGTLGNWGTPAAVINIMRSGRPVLGIGGGGASLFTQMGLSINWGHSWGHTDDGMYVVDSNQVFFKSPNPISIPGNDELTLFSPAIFVYEEYGPKLDPDVVLHGRSLDDADHYSLVQEDNKYMLWGFAGSASGMTAVGEDLFANIVENLISFPYLPVPDLVVTGYEEVGAVNKYYLSVLNRSVFPDVLFAPAPDLPPCGLNENSSRTWVDIYDESHGFLNGFCALSSSESLDGIWFTWPKDETPPNVYVVLDDRRSGIAYTSNLASPQASLVTHTIINNIIVNNNNGIFYYFFAKYDSQILYNDVWGNSARDYHNNVLGSPTFVPYPGTGEISEDPCFADPDYRLDDPSPCRDTGHPGPQYNDPDGSRNDMGAYGGPEASGQGEWSGSGFIFTSIGYIPTAVIVQDDANTSHGLADVNATMASDYGIPHYQDSPFGGLLRIYGLFGDLDTTVAYYQILVAKWTDGVPPAPEDYEPLSRSLAKIRYIINPDFSVSYQNVSLGPKTISGVDNLYQLTREGYWYHVDLRILWDTRLWENGKYTLTYRAFGYVPQMDFVYEVFPTANALDHLTIIVDNSPVNAEIHNVKYDPCSPYYYDPCDGEIPECAIINLTDANENLRFTITAGHPNGYLRTYNLRALYGKNKDGGLITSDSYSPVSPPYWYGVTEQEFQSEDSMALDPWQQCAYQFRLRVYSRTTNGSHYIISKEFNDHYFLNFGESACCWGDLDSSGLVNYKDLAIMAAHWLESYGP